VNQETERNDFSEVEFWKKQITDTLNWLSGYKWAATGIMLFVSTMYWYGFISFEKIPISIASPSVVTSIPIVSVLMAFFIALLVSFACVPTMMFFIPAGEKGGEKHLVVPKTNAEFREVARALWVRWLAIQSFILFALFLIGFLDLDSYGLAFSSLILIISVVAVFFLKSISQFKGGMTSVGFGFWVISVVSMFFQVMLVVLVSVSVSKYLEGKNDCVVFFAVFMCVVALASVQLGVMRALIIALSQRGFLKKMIVALFSMVFFCGIYPPAGSFLFGTALHHTSSGARSCAILSWDKSAALGAVNPEVIGEILGYSKPLRIFIEADGDYIVRTLKVKDSHYIEGEGKAVYFIPRTLVLGMDECPKLTARVDDTQSIP